ncbi:hypothetical protein IAQ61_004445 [Plenodomus lingam]|uniref:uncharacterized protein n=1 Tax=Leptosphaeria maculans TaxID=5022 RepID=UPI00331F9F6E|nr:hypothetical protein IAQ61_004445 [Plenodomus lingam]
MRWDEMGWDEMGWDEMGWDGMGIGISQSQSQSQSQSKARSYPSSLANLPLTSPTHLFYPTCLPRSPNPKPIPTHPFPLPYPALHKAAQKNTKQPISIPGFSTIASPSFQDREMHLGFCAAVVVVGGGGLGVGYGWVWGYEDE